MKSQLELLDSVLEDLGAIMRVDTTMDIKTVHRRFEHEGESFLTIQLPKLRKALERSLESGSYAAQNVPFKVREGIPVFLRGFFCRVFDERTGLLLPAPDSESIWAIRQATGLYGSYFEVCDDRRVRKALREFVSTDLAVKDHEISDLDIQRFQRGLQSAFGVTLSHVERSVYHNGLIPRHSGGSTADRVHGNAKWIHTTWTHRLEEIFPFFHYGVANASHINEKLVDGDTTVTFLSVEEELPVRVIPVPKTQEKPRIISIEPSYMQFMQQGLARALMDGLGEGHNAHIQLRRREHNQEAAKRGSRNGDLATLDLSEASDRLSWDLVTRGFARFPWLVRALDACRTRVAEIDGLGKIELAKFASMGSGVTFPVQTIVFATIVWLGIAEARGIPVGKAVNGNPWVRIFGDDLIVPTDTVAAVIRNLEAFGFKVNSDKSFWNGKFRESCGGEFYSGNDVSYVKVRHRVAVDRSNAQSVASTVALRNKFYSAGLWRPVKLLDDLLGDVLRHYPSVREESGVLGRLSALDPSVSGWSKDLQTDTVRAFVITEKLPLSPLDGHDALLRWFTEVENSVDREPARSDWFERAGRPERVALKLRTVSVKETGELRA